MASATRGEKRPLERYGLRPRRAEPDVMLFRSAQQHRHRLRVYRLDHDALACSEQIEATREIVRAGTSAERQLAIYRAARDTGEDRESALRAVVLSLAEATSA